MTSTPKFDPTADLSSFVSGLSFDDLPSDVVQTSKWCFVDLIGTAMAGVDADAATASRDALIATDDGGSISVLGVEETASVVDAAFANGAAAHALDYDDDQYTIYSHTSAVIVPAVLSVGQLVNATGREAITAHVAGFETEYYIGTALTTKHYEQGWHGTSTLGTFGATAVAASLLNLGEQECKHAFNIATSFPAGLKRNFGTMTKPVHAGAAARTGVTAGLLAAEGATAASDAFTGKGGFFDLYGGPKVPEPAPSGPIGDRFALAMDGVYFKKYPCCYGTHQAIELTRELIDHHNLTPEDIESVCVRTGPISTESLIYDDPETPSQAKFSMPYIVAYTIVHGDINLDAFQPKALDDPIVDAVHQRIDFAADPDLEYDSSVTKIEIRTTDSDRLTADMETVPGARQIHQPTRSFRINLYTVQDRIRMKKSQSSVLIS